MPFISVVICTYARERRALDAIRSVLESGEADFELIVADQDRSGALGERLRREWSGDERLRYVQCDALGLSHARNLAVSRSEAVACVFLDDDARAMPGWLASYREAFSAQPRPAMVGGRTVPEWEARRPAWLPTDRLPLLGLYDAGAANAAFPEDALPVGANFGILREALLAAGGFDTGLGYRAGRRMALAGEDSLVAHRVRRAGGRIEYNAGATAVHAVRAEKLRLREFAWRCFTEGRTQIAILRRTETTGRGSLAGLARWHARALARAPLHLVVRLLARRLPGLEPVGEAIAVACFAAGVTFETVAGARARTAEPAST